MQTNCPPESGGQSVWLQHLQCPVVTESHAILGSADLARGNLVSSGSAPWLHLPAVAADAVDLKLVVQHFKAELSGGGVL